MERRALTLSVLFSFLAMYLVWQYVSEQDTQMQDQYGLETSRVIVVASRDILQYETIRPTDIETLRVPKAMLPKGLIEDPKDVIDAVASVPITKGEHILDNKIISKNVYSGLDTQIVQGRRAFSVPVTVKSGVGYMVRPGNRVDLATYFEYKAEKSNINEVKVFMQDVLVLAVGRTIQAEPPRGVDQSIYRQAVEENQGVSPVEVRETLDFAKDDPVYRTVTLEVTPRQAQILAYVMTVYNDDPITLLLRHSDDRSVDRKLTTNLYAVMGKDSFYARGKKTPPAKPTPRTKFFDLQGDRQIGVGE
ncbi:Flp pilus assembly protein CpaB [bacterium]|nr:Flp pilus assembly protein CpaB [bacterium]